MYLGIDLGTSNSAIAAHDNNQVRIFKAEYNMDTLPSAIHIDRKEHKFIGHRAYQHLYNKPMDTVDGFKLQMGTSWVRKFEQSGVTMSAEECSADILKKLVEQARVESGGKEISGAVVTIPAAFNQMQIEATHRAASRAEIKRVELVQEPVAAAMAAVAASGDRNSQFLVYDIGGGTFDLALVQSIDSKINIVAHEGINVLGGRYFDRLIIKKIVIPWLKENFSLPSHFSENPKYNKIIDPLVVEQAKIELSSKYSSSIYIPEDEVRVADENGNEIYFDIPIQREEYEALIAGQIQKTVELSLKVIADNGYSSEDIERIVFIGGPSKTPKIREIVSEQLGIPGDLKLDPMTAVAIGAAYFCEGLDWSGEIVERKKSRGSKQTSVDAELKFDYPTRTSADRARLKIKPSKETAQLGFEVEINSDEGWTSGRKPLTGNLDIEAPLDRLGDNHFRVMVFSNDGRLLEKAGADLSVNRTAATADSLRRTSAIAVMIRSDEIGERGNVLHLIIDKGQPLPAEGKESGFRAAKDLKDGDDLAIDFFEQPEISNKTPGEPNLHIGRCEITRANLNAELNKGDEIVVHWKINESGLIICKIEIPSLGVIVPGEFYSPKVGEKNYGGDEGNAFVKSMLRDAHRELEEATEIAASSADTSDLLKYKNEHNHLDTELKTSSLGAEEQRGIAERIRGLRQKVARICNASSNQRAALRSELKKTIAIFDELCREEADEATIKRFDRLASNAKEILEKSEEEDCRDAKRIIGELRDISISLLSKNTTYTILLYKKLSSERHLALDKTRFDDSVERGSRLLSDNKTDELREVIGDLFSNRLRTEVDGPDINELADLMRR